MTCSRWTARTTAEVNSSMYGLSAFPFSLLLRRPAKSTTNASKGANIVLIQLHEEQMPLRMVWTNVADGKINRVVTLLIICPALSIQKSSPSSAETWLPPACSRRRRYFMITMVNGSKHGSKTWWFELSRMPLNGSRPPTVKKTSFVIILLKLYWKWHFTKRSS